MDQETFVHQGTSLLFPTPLTVYEVSEAEQINEALLQEIETRRLQDRNVVRSGRNGWHSKFDFFKRTEPGHRALAAVIRGAVEDATRRFAGDPAIFESVSYRINGWINVNPQHAYNVPHDHGGSFWSGAYYVAIAPADDESGEGGAISFIDPRSGLAGQALVKSSVFVGSHTVYPKPGTLLLFPGNIKHWVHPNPAETDRVTVAFNVAFGVGAF